MFDGEVVALGVEQSTGGLPITVVEAMDRSHRLSSTVNPTTYLNQTSSAIVSAIAGEHGLDGRRDRHRDDARVRAQDRQRPRLPRRAGRRASASSGSSRGTKLTFRPRPALGTPAISLGWSNGAAAAAARAPGRARSTGRVPVEVRGWDDATLDRDRRAQQRVDRRPRADRGERHAGHGRRTASGAETFGGTMMVTPRRARSTRRRRSSGPRSITADLQVVDAAHHRRVRAERADHAGNVAGDRRVRDEAVGHVLRHRRRARLRRPPVAGHPLPPRAAAGPPDCPGSATPVPAAFGQVGLVIGVVTNVKEDPKKHAPRQGALPDPAERRERLGAGRHPRRREGRAAWRPGPRSTTRCSSASSTATCAARSSSAACLSKTDAYRTGAVNSDGSINKRGIRTRGGNKLEMFDGDSKSATHRAVHRPRRRRRGDRDPPRRREHVDEDEERQPDHHRVRHRQDHPGQRKDHDHGRLDRAEGHAGVQGPGQRPSTSRSNTAIGIDAGTTMKLQGSHGQRRGRVVSPRSRAAC